MPKPLSLSRAAKIAGVTRGELQKRLRDSGLNIFEGKIAVGDLLTLYPDVDLDRDPVFERIQQIKQAARPKREYSDGWIPEPEILLARLKEVQSVLSRTKAMLNRSDALIDELFGRLEQIGEASESPTRAQLDTLRDWLKNQREAELKAEKDARAELFARDALFKLLAAKVKVTPSGHEYLVEGRESLLEAALRSGLHLDFGCSSGNCGACRCRVVSGKVAKLRDHDYILGTREREAGYVLACSCTAVTDVVIEAHEATSPADIPAQDIRAVVTGVERCGDGGVALHLQTPRTRMLRFMSGQTAHLTDEHGATGSYPLASCACDGRNLELLIRRQPADPFSLALFDREMIGEMVRVEGPSGDFVLHEDSAAPCVFVAAAGGIGPIKGLVEQAISIDSADRLHACLVEDPAWGEKYHNLFRSWDDALDNFRLTRLAQHTTAAALRDLLLGSHPDLPDWNIYAAGPRSFTERLGRILGVDIEQGEGRMRLLAVDA
jgi:CDP-4-dehydro-6-deoxyglucose reductase